MRVNVGVRVSLLRVAHAAAEVLLWLLLLVLILSSILLLAAVAAAVGLLRLPLQVVVAGIRLLRLLLLVVATILLRCLWLLLAAICTERARLGLLLRLLLGGILLLRILLLWVLLRLLLLLLASVRMLLRLRLVVEAAEVVIAFRRTRFRASESAHEAASVASRARRLEGVHRLADERRGERHARAPRERAVSATRCDEARDKEQSAYQKNPFNPHECAQRLNALAPTGRGYEVRAGRQ